MAKKIGTDKHKVMAAILYDKFNYSQESIAKLMNVSQSTISSWISYGRLLIQNMDLKNFIEKFIENICRINNQIPLEYHQEILDI